MKSFVLLLTVTLLACLTLPDGAHAMKMCAKIDKETGMPKDGSPVKLRTTCKTKKTGEPVEVSIGESQDLEQIPMIAADLSSEAEERALKGELLEAEFESEIAAVRDRRAKAETTGRLSEVQATTTAAPSLGASSLDLQNAINGMESQLLAEFASITLFEVGSLTSTSFDPEALQAASTLNDWIDAARDVELAINANLTLARSLAFGPPVNLGAVAASLMQLNLALIRSVFEGPKHAAMVAASQNLRDEMSLQLDAQGPDVVGDDVAAASADLDRMADRRKTAQLCLGNAGQIVHEQGMALFRGLP